MNIAQKTKGIVFKNYSFDEGYIVNELKKLMQQYESTEAFVDYFYKLDGDDWIADSYIGEKSSLLNREPYYWVCGLDSENLEVLLGLMGWVWDSVAEKWLTHFKDDEEKMEDFKNLTKEEFLNSYSYLTDCEYELTKKSIQTN